MKIHISIEKQIQLSSNEILSFHRIMIGKFLFSKLRYHESIIVFDLFKEKMVLFMASSFGTYQIIEEAYAPVSHKVCCLKMSFLNIYFFLLVLEQLTILFTDEVTRRHISSTYVNFLLHCLL